MGRAILTFTEEGCKEKMKTSKYHLAMPALIFIVLLTGCSWSRGDIAWGVASTIATAADGYTTSQFLDNPANRELNPILGEHPSDGKIFMVLATSQIIMLTIVHFFPEMRPYILPGKTVLNTGLAIHNYQLDWEGEEQCKEFHCTFY